MLVIGIDPGKKGGIALMGEGQIDFSSSGGMLYSKNYDLTDWVNAARMLAGDDAGVVAYVELVHSMPSQGVASTFSFGKGFGEILGWLSALQVRTELVSPQKWKRAVLAGTDRDKAAAIRFVQENYPDIDLTPGRCRVPQDGIADAVCIAHYGMLQEINQ